MIVKPIRNRMFASFWIALNVLNIPLLTFLSGFIVNLFLHTSFFHGHGIFTLRSWAWMRRSYLLFLKMGMNGAMKHRSALMLNCRMDMITTLSVFVSHFSRQL